MNQDTKIVKPTHSEKGRGQVQSLSRAFGLLEYVAGDNVGLGLSQIAAQMELAPSTVHRLLNSMREMGYVECDQNTGLWSVGLKAFTIGNTYLRKREFAVQARSYMKKLVGQVGETVNLAIMDDRNVVFIAQVECSHVMRMAVPIGTRGPLHASAVGKIMMSSMTNEEVRGILENIEFTKLTSKTHQGAANLIQELEKISLQNYAVDEEEQNIGMRCIAANIYNEYSEAVAAISVSGPTVRLVKGNIKNVSRLVIETAQEITSAIGGSPPKKEKE